ncbi:MAG TPA: hypothetical protein VIS95_00120, partial [Solirubrobacterales bacterium]
MIRQAQTYLVGAVSGTTLIVAAVLAFVALVSLQGLRDWPLAGIGGGDEAAETDVIPVQPAAVGAGAADDQGAVGTTSGAGKAGTRAAGANGGSTSPAAGSPVAGAPGAGAPGASPAG